MQRGNFKAREVKSWEGRKGVSVPGSWIRFGIALLLVLLAGTCSRLGGRSSFDSRLKLAVRDMGVDLRGRDVPVAESFLNQQQVAGLVQQRSGECVPQCMGCDSLVDSSPLDPYRDQQLHSSRLKSGALLIDEQGIAVLPFQELGPFASNIGLDGFARANRQELDDRVAPLGAFDSQMFAVYILEVQSYQLTHTNTGVQQQVDNRVITNGMISRAVVSQAVEKFRFFLIGEVDRWLLSDAGGLDAGSGVVLDFTSLLQPGQEGPQGSAQPVHAVLTTGSVVGFGLLTGKENIEYRSGDVLRIDDMRSRKESQVAQKRRDGVRRFASRSQMGFEVQKGFIPSHDRLLIVCSRRIQRAVDLFKQQGNAR